MHAFLENVIIFVTTTPIDIPAHVLHVVDMRLRAKFRCRTTWHLGGDRPRQNKQTLKYLVDDNIRKKYY